MADMYFVISNSDGDVTVSQYDNNEALLQAIEDGDIDPDEVVDELDGAHLGYGNQSRSHCMDNGGTIIIKGKLVKPSPKEVVTKYEVD
jgi:hypothetical protein